MMSTWEQVLLGVFALLILLWFWPGVKVHLQRSREAQERDWLAVLVPIAVVVLFVILLALMLRS